MEKLNYPDYVPADVIAAHKRTLFHWEEEGAEIANRLILRRCMEKVYRDVGKMLNGLPKALGPSGDQATPWDHFFEVIVTMEGDFEQVTQTIKPMRKELKRRMGRTQKLGTQLFADLKWAMDGSSKGPEYHGLGVPEEFDNLDVIEKIVEAASKWDKQSLYDDFAVLSGFSIPTKTTREIHYARSVHACLRKACNRGLYGFPSAEKFKLPYLLSYDNYARITRAALDLPDDLGPYKRSFSGEDLRLAKAFSSTP